MVILVYQEINYCFILLYCILHTEKNLQYLFEINYHLFLKSASFRTNFYAGGYYAHTCIYHNVKI